jgi:hypothetical protein
MVGKDVPLLRKIDVVFPQVMQRMASLASSIAKENEGKVIVGEDGGEGHFVMARCPRGHPHCHQRHHLSMWGVYSWFVAMIP